MVPKCSVLYEPTLSTLSSVPPSHSGLAALTALFTKTHKVAASSPSDFAGGRALGARKGSVFDVSFLIVFVLLQFIVAHNATATENEENDDEGECDWHLDTSKLLQKELEGDEKEYNPDGLIHVGHVGHIVHSDGVERSQGEDGTERGGPDHETVVGDSKDCGYLK